MPTERATLRQRMFAKFMAGQDASNDEQYRDKKSALLGQLRGTVLEIGPGTGVNLSFFDPSIRWIGIEPNCAMHAALREKAAALKLSIELRDAPLAADNFDSDSADAVVSTLVLCSLPDMGTALAQIHRVLKPGGTFAFIEHVADRRGSPRWLLQKSAPYSPYHFFSDGCDPGRDIGGAIHAAGFSAVECTPYMQTMPFFLALYNRPHIYGTAVK